VRGVVMKFKVIGVSFLSLFLSFPFVSHADWFESYTSYKVEEKLGRIVISDELVRGEEYSNYVNKSNAAELEKIGVFPENVGKAYKFEEKMDGHDITVMLGSLKRLEDGSYGDFARGFRVRVYFDGKLKIDSTMGDNAPELIGVKKIVIYPSDNMIYIYAYKHHDIDGENFKLNAKEYSRDTTKIQEHVLFMEEMEGIEGKPVFTDEWISAEGKPFQ
jgi:hypothetical protein